MLAAKRTKNLIAGTRGPVYDEALRLQAEGEKILKINTGNPAAFGFEMPESLKQASIKSFEKATAYTVASGLAEAKEAILDYDISKGFNNINTNDIFLGNGVSELAEMVCSALLDPEDEILCPCPNYNLWTNSALLADANPVFYRCHEDKAWMPDATEIESLITEKTKAIVIINPNNPTGALYSDELLKDIAAIAKKHNLVILADEIYDRLVMDGKVHTSIAKLAPNQPIITFNGLSKSHIICGFRCGWMTLSGFDDEDGQNFKSVINTYASIRLCSNALGQYCVKAALNDPVYTKQMMSPGGMVYERREACINTVNNSKCLSVVKNTGALYCFVRINPDICKITNDKDFTKALVREKHILVVQGSGFDYPEPNYFRIVMLPTPEELEKAVQEIDDFCMHYNEKYGK